MPERINIDEPLWDQSTFVGRFKHFMWVTDMRVGLCSDEQLDNAKLLVEQYRLGREPPGTTLEQVIYAKKLFNSSFHPDSGEKQNVFGRMSFQVPGGMIITGGMLQFYRSSAAVIFWQWINQSFNALVNFTNRNAKSPISTTQLGVAYVSATASAMVTALSCKYYWQKAASPFFQRYVPFAAVAAANCVNIPLMRQSEIAQGIDVYDSNGNKVGQSRIAACKGITQVTFSRIVMAAPGMLLMPIVMEKLEKFEMMRRLHVLHMPMQVMMIGCFLIFMVPTACGLFPQRCTLNTSTIKFLESAEYERMLQANKGKLPDVVYFNKGL